jgi:SMODS-associated NUDIX domain
MSALRLGLFTILAAASVAWLLLGDTSDTTATAMATGALAGLIVLAVDRPPQVRWLPMAIYTTLRCRGRLVRISVSYLFRIKVGNRYLLIRNERRPETFAPVGGVYKRLPGSEKRLERLKTLDDDCHAIDERSVDDLRVRVPGWNVVRFLRWFERGEHRELSPWRELFEELVGPGHLSAENFPYVFYRQLDRHWTYPRWSRERQRFEMFLADTFELLPSPEQRAEIAALQTNEVLRWATEEEIRALGTIPNEQPVPIISERAIWTL